MSRHFSLLSVALCWVVGSYSVNLDIRWNHLQAVGSHNSYHIANSETIPSWNYTHAAPGVQLQVQGIRQFEFDINTPGFTVYHVSTYDESSNCATLSECLISVRNFSAANPTHAPIFVMIEAKNTSITAQEFDTFDTIVTSAIGRSNLVTPDDVISGATAANLREVVTKGLWPTIESTRGKIVVILLGNQDAYVQGNNAQLSGRSAFICLHFAMNNTENAGFLCEDDATVFAPQIYNNSAAGFMIRTRADSEYNRGDPSRATATIYTDYFNVMDIDVNNLVSKAEALAFFAALEIAASSSNVDTLFKLCSAGPNGTTLAQFQCAMGIIVGQGVAAVPAIPTFAEVVAQRDNAFNNGAHFISTDWDLIPCENADPALLYWVDLPGNYSFRCNPVTTANISFSCSDVDFENVVVTHISNTPCSSSTTGTVNGGSSTTGSASSSSSSASGVSTGANEKSGASYLMGASSAIFGLLLSFL